MANWFAGAVIYRVNEKGVLEFMVMDCKSTDPKYAGKPMQTKFVGGTEDGHLTEDVTVLGTLRRELTEETDMRIPENDPFVLIHSDNLPGHFKNFYLIAFDTLEGVLRSEPKTIEYDWMSKPYWVDYQTACRVLFRTHQPALIKAHDRLEVKRAS